MCVFGPDTSQQPNRAVIVGLLYNNQWFACATNHRGTSIFCLPAMNDGTDMEGGGEGKCVCLVVMVGGMRNQEEGWIERWTYRINENAVSLYLFSIIKVPNWSQNKHSVNYLAHIVVYVPQRE